MSTKSRFLAPLRAVVLAAGGFSILGTGVLAPRASAAPPRYKDILPLNQVKPGMVGYGLTTFHGTTISRFKVTVIGIVKNSNSGHDLILVKMQGGPITQRGANLIHGMSGSPIYLNGKVAGAFSMGENFPKEPIGSVTPIEDMLEAWDPEIPQKPDFFNFPEKTRPLTFNSPTRLEARKPQTLTLAHPLTFGDRSIKSLVLNAPANDRRQSSGSVAVLHPATSFLTLGGVSEKNREWFQKELDKRGFAMTLMGGGGGGSNSKAISAPPLRPGSCFGTLLSTGDVIFGGFGTLTYRSGNRFLGFGHPLLGLGPLDGAVTTAEVVDVFSGYQTSHLITVPGPVVGALSQDRNFSVSGDLGKMPKLIPFEVSVKDATTRRSKVFHCQIFQHPELSPALLSLIIKEAVSQIHSSPGDAMAQVTTTVDAEEIGKVTRKNLYFDNSDISQSISQDMSDITTITSSNPFYPLPIKSASVSVEILPGRQTATLERIYLKQGRFEPGDTAEVGVVLKPFRKETVTKTISIKIPNDTPSGRYQLIVRGGTANVVRFGGFILGGGGDPQTPPANIRQMVSKLKDKETNTDLVARLILNSAVPSLEGEKMSLLPPNISALMRSDRNSGVRLERDEIKTVIPAGYIASGTQILNLTVVKKNNQEPNSVGAPNQSPPPDGSNGFPLAPSGGRIPLGASSGEESVSAAPSGSSMSGEFLPIEWKFPATAWMDAMSSAPPKEKQDKPKKAVKSPAEDKSTSQPPAVDATKPTLPPAPVAPALPDTSNDKPVGRALQVWRQAGRNDFSLGKFNGTSLAANGTMRLAPTLQRVASTGETYLWALASDETGNLYAGTGNTGKVLKLDPSGKLSTLVTLPAVTVQSLVYSKTDRCLYAGTSLKARVYRVALDGSYKLITKLSEKYVLALHVNDRGDLTIAPGGGGNVYRITQAQLNGASEAKADFNQPSIKEALQPYFKTSADHIMALEEDSEHNLYVGTGNDGVIYKVSPDGVGKVLYDAKENAITALALDSNGNLYSATGPRGVLYRTSPDGTTTAIFERAASFYTGLKAAADGSLFATTTNAVFHIVPSKTDPNQPHVIPMDNPKEIDFLSLALLQDGKIAVGTGNVGEIYGASAADLSGKTSLTGVFESVVHDSRISSKWGRIRLEGSVPAGASVKVETRTGDSAEPDATWSAWNSATPNESKTEAQVSGSPARFIQYRLTLTGKGEATPSIREVSLSYLPKNQAPKVAFQLPVGGERWAKTQTLRWAGSDPDSDALTYELHYSTDAGITWNPLPAAKPAIPTVPPAVAPATPIVSSTTTQGGGSIKMTVREAPAVAITGVAGNPPPASPPGATTLEEFEKTLNAQNYPPQIKQALLEGFKQRNANGGKAALLKEPTRSFDTSLLPDGIYWLKVVATDSVSNPVDPLSSSAISEPFLICNATPKIAFSSKTAPGANSLIMFEGSVSQTLISITAVQYRVDGGDWVAATPKDGIFDSSRESFSFIVSSPAAGKRTIEVEAFNSAGQKSVEKMEIIIP